MLLIVYFVSFTVIIFTILHIIIIQNNYYLYIEQVPIYRISIYV